MKVFFLWRWSEKSSNLHRCFLKDRITDWTVLSLMLKSFATVVGLWIFLVKFVLDLKTSCTIALLTCSGSFLLRVFLPTILGRYGAFTFLHLGSGRRKSFIWPMVGSSSYSM